MENKIISNVSQEAKQFGEYLRELRLQNRMSLDNVTKKCGVSKGYLGKLERGYDGSPSVKILKDLANTYNVSILKILKVGGYLKVELEEAEIEGRDLGELIDWLKYNGNMVDLIRVCKNLEPTNLGSLISYAEFLASKNIPDENNY
jgi:transcriptional regulator with XRE-family HTH domain